MFGIVDSSFVDQTNLEVFFTLCDIYFMAHRFSETLEFADDMAIDVPHIWLYLAQLVTPVLREGGISMRELFRCASNYCRTIPISISNTL